MAGSAENVVGATRGCGHGQFLFQAHSVEGGVVFQ